MMRIAVVNLTGGGFSGGYRKYLSRLMPLLAADPRVESLTVFVPKGAAVRIEQGIDVRPLQGVRGEIGVVKPDVVFVPTARYVDVGAIPVVNMVRNMAPRTVPVGGDSGK